VHNVEFGMTKKSRPSAGKLLLVEDDYDSRIGLATILKMEGYEVRTAMDGSEALETLRQGFRPGLILLDLMMPVMNGTEFRAAQRLEPGFAAVPVVLLSGTSEIKVRAAELDTVGYLLKPIRMRELLETVGKYCPRAAAA
jgi:CheY-like chemotaxis protein